MNFILPIFGGSAPASFTADLSSLAADDSLLVIFERSSEWIFVSEVQFEGSAAAAVPEPGTCGLMLVGLAVVGGVARRKRSTRLSTKAP